MSVVIRDHVAEMIVAEVDGPDLVITRSRRVAYDTGQEVYYHWVEEPSLVLHPEEYAAIIRLARRLDVDRG